MSQSSAKSYVKIGREVTWGTPVSATFNSGLLVQSVSPTFEREVNDAFGIGNIQTQFVYSGLQGAGLSINGHIQDTKLFEFILGEATHVETTDDWKHTFAIDNEPASITAEVGVGDTSQTLSGLLNTSAEISIDLNGALTLNTEWIGKDTTADGTSSTGVANTLPIFTHANAYVKIDDTNVDEVQNASISITKTVERVGGISDTAYKQAHAVDMIFEFSATIGFAAETYHSLSLGTTDFTFAIGADNGVDLGDGRREFVFKLKECKASGFNQPIEVGGIVFLEISGKGVYDTCFGVDNIETDAWPAEAE